MASTGNYFQTWWEFHKVGRTVLHAVCGNMCVLTGCVLVCVCVWGDSLLLATHAASALSKILRGPPASGLGPDGCNKRTKGNIWESRLDFASPCRALQAPFRLPQSCSHFCRQWPFRGGKALPSPSTGAMRPGSGLSSALSPRPGCAGMQSGLKKCVLLWQKRVSPPRRDRVAGR